MAEINIDGKTVTVADGSVVMHAADVAGIYVPHFCYHKKLSIAANCRMCLVDIEKMPKPMPACATPVTNGMVVRTKSEKALKAQQSVMEFLLINHPLDCPICDQGGECQLQDLAVGYGGSASRYQEEKRVVFHKDIGPLVSMKEMSRCIHCTRCVRFGQEVAGVMELGMIHRGEHSEITTVAGRTVDSELSGNMIDICPVGALTSKPFRYSARTWELSRRKSISPHDSTGANIIVQVKAGKVMRVLPLENEAVNECWIADRDRFSYEALNSDSRLKQPMIKQGGVWQAVDWNTALAYVADGLKRVIGEFGASAVGALTHAGATVEEMHLLAKLVRGLGSENIDHRSRHADFSNAAASGHARWLGMPIAALGQVDSALIVGSFLRKDHPLFAQRLRQAAKRGAALHSLQAVHDDDLVAYASRLTVAPLDWAAALAEIAAAVAAAQSVAAPVTLSTPLSEAAQAVAASLLSSQHSAVLLGNAAAQHPQASELLALAQWIAEATESPFGYLCEGGNPVGAQLVDAMPGPDGLHAGQMLSQPMKALLLLHTEPVLDSANPIEAQRALAGAGLVVALTPFKDVAADLADVMLPIAPFTETAGSLVNAEGRLQRFHGVVPPLADTRPGWKVLRVLGNLLSLPGFDFETVDAVREEVLPKGLDLQTRLSNAAAPGALARAVESVAASLAESLTAHDAPMTELQRISDVPIYCTDATVRRAASLQLTADAADPVVGVPSALWRQLGLQEPAKVLVAQGEAALVLPAREDSSLHDHTVRIASGHPSTLKLGAMFGPITVEKV